MAEITRDLTAQFINEIEDIAYLTKTKNKVETFKLLEDINANFGEYMARLSVMTRKEKQQYKNCPFPLIQFRTISNLEFNIKKNIATLLCAIQYKECQMCFQSRHIKCKNCLEYVEVITCYDKYKRKEEDQ